MKRKLSFQLFTSLMLIEIAVLKCIVHKISFSKIVAVSSKYFLQLYRF